MTPLLMPSNLTEKMIRDVIEANQGKGFAVQNIPIEEYHRGPGISSSDIKALINGTVESWLHAKANPEEPTRALILGNAIHTCVLEADDFWNRYCKEDDCPKAPSRSTKEGKDEWKEFCALYPDELFGNKDGMTADQWKSEWMKWRHPSFKKIPLSSDEIETCFGIQKSVREHPMVSQMFAEGETELSMYWIDPETNILCKARTDRLNKTFPCIPDLKSTQDASLDSFENDITVHDYEVSAWWYLWGAKTVFEFDFQDFVYVPCEKHPPYQVTFYTADEGSLALGEGLCRAGLTILKRHLDGKQEWKGFSLEPKTAGVRPWAFNKLSQVIHAQDLQGMGLEKYIGG